LASDGRIEEVRYSREGSGIRTPEEEIERLYEQRWRGGWDLSGASLYYMMWCLVQAGEYEAVAMHFRNAYIARSKREPKAVLDEYHRRNDCECMDGHVKEHYAFEVGLNVVGTRAITRHVLQTMIAAHVVAMVRLQHGVTGNLLSTTHIH
jgi:hypothetical protein